MPVTPGAAGKLNTIKGISKIINTSSAEETTLASKVFPSGLIVKKSDGKIYVTDGVTTLAALQPRVDQVVDSAEKGALSAAFSTGSYVIAAGGVVVHDGTGKISDDSLNLVDNGKLVESYLSEYIDQTTHKVLLSALPDTVRAGVTYVADITARDALSAEQKKSLAFVIDATADTTVTQGSAMYAWDASQNSGSGAWVKIAEVESLDIDVAAIECSYTNMQAGGAVMYDHELEIGMTATELGALLDAAAGSGS
jgi:hypothetical protein